MKTLLNIAIVGALLWATGCGPKAGTTPAAAQPQQTAPATETPPPGAPPVSQ